MKRISLILLAWIIPTLLFSQKEASFRPQYASESTQKVERIFTHSDTIPLEDLGELYSLSIDATIHQPREASFTRIVLEDKNGHDYLVAESDWFRNDTTIVNLSDYCEETAMLDGIEPAFLKCYLSDAYLTIHSISTAPYKTRRTSNAISAKDLKRQQVLNIVNRINTYNRKNLKLWKAGATPLALSKYNNRHYKGLEEDSYINNMIYYEGGIYEMGDMSNIETREGISSNYIDSFDFRNRHGRDWLTIAKNQDSSNWCGVFSSVAAVELMTNLYFNDTINLDLSEQDVANNLNFTSWLNATWPSQALDIIKLLGVIDEHSFPTTYNSLPSVRPQGIEKIYLRNFETYSRTGLTADSIKHLLINKGPIVSGVQNKSHHHAMLLVGYNIVEANKIYYRGDDGWYTPALPEDDYRIGQPYWIFKNSYYGNPMDNNGCMYVFFNDISQHFLGTSCIISPQMFREGHTDSDIVVEDRDGDGYFNWGIGPKPAHCPAWAPDEPDGDDSDATLGPMDEYGYCASILPTDTIFIDSDEQYSSGYRHVTKNICIRNNSTLTVSCDLSMNHLAEIRIKSGATLVINGCIRNANIKPEVGSTIILNNGGLIVTYKDESFKLPVGATMQINEGVIK